MSEEKRLDLSDMMAEWGLILAEAHGFVRAVGDTRSLKLQAKLHRAYMEIACLLDGINAPEQPSSPPEPDHD